MSFLKGIMFGVGFSLVIAIFVGLGMAHSLDSVTENIVSEHHAEHMGHTGHMEHHMGSGMHGCMNSCEGKTDEECIDEMDKDKDGICDMCGMPVEDCLEMKASSWR